MGKTVTRSWILFSPAAPGCRSAPRAQQRFCQSWAGQEQEPARGLPGCHVQLWTGARVLALGGKMECGHKCEPCVTVCVCCSERQTWASSLWGQSLHSMFFFIFYIQDIYFCFLEEQSGGTKQTTEQKLFDQPIKVK